MAESLIGLPLDYAGSEKLGHVDVGDTLWPVTTDNGALYLIGRVVVGTKIQGQENAEEFFKNRRLWQSTWHVAAQPGTVSVGQWLDLSGIVGQLRFDSKADRLTVLPGNKINGQQLRSNRKLTQASVALLANALELEPEPVVVPEPPASSAGAGFGADPETNKAVELAAMKVTIDRYQGQGWKVADVSAEKRGYDLVCARDGVERHVEVKGVQGALPLFMITAGEVRTAESDQRFFVAVVTSALTSDGRLVEYSAKDFFLRFQLVPVTFQAQPNQADASG